MTYRVFILPSALKDLERLSKEDYDSVRDAMLTPPLSQIIASFEITWFVRSQSAMLCVPPLKARETAFPLPL